VWILTRKNKFKTQYKKLPPQIQTKTDEGLIALAESINPRSLGEYKQFMEVWAYELNDSYRILYIVKDSENI
jgi:mRNA-degrading endonuclease RelE of RelBE toxin-antitoxin system